MPPDSSPGGMYAEPRAEPSAVRRIFAVGDIHGCHAKLARLLEALPLEPEGDQIRPQDLPQDLQELEFDTMKGEALLTLEELEKGYIAKVLEKTRFNKGLTAQILDVPRTTPWRKLKSCGLE